MHYFAYGVNLNRTKLAEYCPGVEFIGAALLKGHRLIFDGKSIRRDGATANIMPAEGAEVWGGLFSIGEKELAELDAFEDYPTSYQRKTVSVSDMNGVEYADAIVYYREGQPEGLPGAEYLKEVLDGMEMCGLPVSYIEKVHDELDAAGLEA
jgi:gamma-glutamylcyclotransferase (GGCT)/AIG2-like uncharacterized protein YtfP